MGTPLIQPSFAAGELAPALHARVDLAKYHIGLATCLNWMIMAQGGAQNRPGTLWVGPCIDHEVRSRLIPFQFNTEQAYALEFGHQTMRVIKDGGYVTEAAQSVVAASNASSGVIEITGHGWSNGDRVYASGIGGMTELNGRYFTVAGATTDTFQLSGVDTSGYGAFTSGGTFARLYTLATPYAAADLPTLKFTQSADTLTLTHPGYAPRDLTRSGHASWALSTITFASEQAAPTGVTATPSSVSGSAPWSYVVTAINAESGEESLPSSAGNATFKQEHDWNAATGDFISVHWTNAAGAGSYNVYKQRNGIYGFVGNAGDGPTGFVDDKIRADTTDAPPGSRNPFDGAGEWPGCVNYHEQRKFFGGSANKPQTIWATASGSYKNMNVSTPTQDDDAITRTIASRQVNEIRHLVSVGALIVFTSGAEWMCWPGAQADVLTPANTNLRAQSYAGANHVPPIVVNDSILFVQEKGSIVRDLRYQFEKDGWTGVDLSVMAAHLFDGHAIQEWAWAQVPHKVVWAVRDDGVLLALTYMREHEVFAWARHVTDGTVESVCVISEGSEDVLYMTVARTVGGQTVRYVERMASRMFSQLRDAWFLDCALAYDGNNAVTDDYLKITGAGYDMGDSVTLQATGHAPFSAASVGRIYELRSGDAKVRATITAYTDGDTVTARLETNAPAALQDTDTADWALLASSVGGLWHLEGRTVDVFADGSKMPEVVVGNGTAALERPASRALVGLPYDCDLQTLDADAGQPTVQGRRKRVGQVVVRVDESRGLLVGPSASSLTEIKERSDEAYGEPIALFTGDREVLIEPKWGDGGRVYLRATPGLPARVLAIIPRLDVGG
ncbi:MAG: hypothetical protein KF889_25395 [Alphaproteobacteria bacterium]|nr:hypothetical protein [Alphaproteobacteria bacterium]